MYLRVSPARRTSRLGGLGGTEAEDEDKISLAAAAEALYVRGGRVQRGDATAAEAVIGDVGHFLDHRLPHFNDFESGSTWGYRFSNPFSPPQWPSSKQIKATAESAARMAEVWRAAVPAQPVRPQEAPAPEPEAGKTLFSKTQPGQAPTSGKAHYSKTPPAPEERVVAPSADVAAYWRQRAAEIRGGVAPADSTASRLLNRQPSVGLKPAAVTGVSKQKPKPSPGGGPLDTADRDQAIFDLASGRPVDLSIGPGGLRRDYGSTGGSSKAVAGVALAVAGVATIVLVAVVLRPRS